MEKETIQKLIDAQNWKDLFEDINGHRPAIDFAKLKAQYNPLEHDILNTAIFKDREINVGTEEKPELKFVSRARLALPEQRDIVAQQTMMLCGNPVGIHATPKDGTREQDLLDVLNKTGEDNKLDYRTKEACAIWLSECIVAELWYFADADENYWDGTPNEGANGKNARLRHRLLANSLGDTLIPIKDQYNDLVAFYRAYSVKEGEKDILNAEIYTPDFIYYFNNRDGAMLPREKEPIVENTLGKIPIAYVTRAEAAWHPVQPIIAQKEISFSGHVDTNAYSADPTTVVEGEVLSYSQKGEKGKILQIDKGGKVYTVEWNQATASIELEHKNLDKAIRKGTGTVDISLDVLQQAGDYSGAALEVLFLSAYMKASENEILFGEFIQRRLNILKAAMAVINPDLKAATALQLKPRFEYYRPKNIQETVNVLSLAVSAKLISEETAVDLNPLIEDKEGEKARLKAEAAEAIKMQQQQFKSAGGLDDTMNNEPGLKAV